MSKLSNKENFIPSEDEIEEYNIKTRSKKSAALIFRPIVKTAKTGRKRKLLDISKKPKKDEDSIIFSEDEPVDAKNNEDSDDDDDDDDEEEIQPQTSKRPKYSPNQATEEQNKARVVIQSLSKFEHYIKLSKSILHLHCELLRTNVKVKAEKLDKSIKEHHNSLIKQIDSYEKASNKRIDKRTEICKYNDIITDFKIKLADHLNPNDNDEDEDNKELKQLYNKINEAKEDYKRYIFGKKRITFEEAEASKNLNPVGTLKEKLLYKSTGLDVNRLIEDYEEADDENNNLDIDDGDSNGLMVTENLTITKFRLKPVNIIQKIKFKSSESHENMEKFISKIDYDKVVLCNKLSNSFECDFKIIDINAHNKKDLICKEFRMQYFDLTSLKTSNQFIFLLGKRILEDSESYYVLEKYDQEFSLNNTVKFSGTPLAIACNQNYLFVLVEESFGSCFIETYSCDNLTQLLRSNYAFDEKVNHVDMFVNDDNFLIIILNRKNCLKFSTVAELVDEAKTSITSTYSVNDKIEFKLLNNFEFNGLLQNFFVDSLLNLIFIENSDLNYYSLNKRRYIKQFLIDDAGNDDKILVTNDGYFVLYKNDNSLEIY